MSDTNPVLEALDDALDKVEAALAKIKSVFVRTAAMNAVALVRDALKLPDNYGGDAD